MPIYEYYCEHCNGVYEVLRPIREAADPVPCPDCYRDGRRMMPSSFSAFTFRDGYPRRIPDRGTYWHLEQEVSKPVTGGVRPNEHPEINKPEPKRKPTKAEQAEKREREVLEQKEQTLVAKETPPPGSVKSDF